MPNWCDNAIKIMGSKDKIQLLRNILEDEPRKNQESAIVFQTLIGRLPGMSKEEYDNEGWYKANVEWFGTKWDVSLDDCNIEYTDDCITMSPLTAWSPPTDFLSNLCRMYGVTAWISFQEPGADFYGVCDIDESGEMDEETYPYVEGYYHHDKESFWDGIIDNEMEFAYDVDKEPEEFSQGFSFCTNEEREKIKQMYIEFLNKKSEE